jgi:Asp-tRNA(Asn)/Glu-tRNA(Gln) amidotransferase A subunit family amidase
LYNLYDVAKDWKLTPEQQTLLKNAAAEAADHHQREIAAALENAQADYQREIAALAEAAAAAMKEAIAELEEYSMPEILHALRATYGAKPDPTRRLELLFDKNGQLPEYVSMKKAREYARVSPRRIQQLTAGDERTLRTVGIKGHRRVHVGDLTAKYPPEK